MKLEWAKWLLPAGVALLLAGCTLAVAPDDSVSPLAPPVGATPVSARRTQRRQLPLWATCP